MSSKKKPKRPLPPSRRKGVRIYTLEVELIGGPLTKEFVDANPAVTRTIQMLGDQTLEEFHWAIFDAFGRFDDHMYEFQFGVEPMEPGADRYIMYGDSTDDYMERRAAGFAPRTDLDKLKLTTGQKFFYWFDFKDDWWHVIKVVAVDLGKPAGEYPRVVAEVGPNPPQYLFLEGEDLDDEYEGEDEDFDDDEDQDGPIVEGVRFVELDEDGEEKPAPQRDAGDDPKPRP